MQRRGVGMRSGPSTKLTDLIVLSISKAAKITADEKDLYDLPTFRGRR
nr:hypothetical protein [uncultured organism]